MKKIFVYSFLIFLLLPACGGGGGDSEPTHLTVTFKYDVTEPFLAGFRYYNAADKTLLLDTTDYSTYCNIEEHKSQNQPATLSFAIPLSEITSPEIRKGASINITAYSKYYDNTEDESAFSTPMTIQ